MDDCAILNILKKDVLVTGGSRDDYLMTLIDAAKIMIAREGITLDSTDIADSVLIEMYAAYLYRKRKEPAAAMPRMLRYDLNNRLFGEKGRL